MQRLWLILAVAVPVVLLWTGAAHAHLPRVISGRSVVTVHRPEVSQAFYAVLSGEPHVYEIDSDDGFRLYVNLLVPDLPGVRTDVSASVVGVDQGGDEVLLGLIDGDDHAWGRFYEPFAGDRYLMGPEFEQEVAAGRYRIRVFNRDNAGRYVLCVGRREVFTPGDIVHTIRTLPVLKRDFFDKSPLTAYLNLVGLFMLVAITVPAAAIWYGVRRLRR